MSDALQTLYDLASDGKESRPVAAVVREFDERLTALETAQIEAAEQAPTEPAPEA